MTTAIHGRPGAGTTTCLRMGRLSLRKGEVEGEGPSWFNCVCSFQTPHLNPLQRSARSRPRGRGDRDHSTNATFR
jgi:hypothetical protein